METTEEWRPVVGWEGRYEVSDQGRVRSLAHSTPGRANVPAMHFGERILDGAAVASGHRAVWLYRDGRRTLRYIHRLVLESFVSPRPEGEEACHNDGNPANNNLANLRWDTKSANHLDKVRHGRHPFADRTHCPQGHEYTPDNTYVSPATGSRSCRSCRRQKNAERYARSKAA